MASIETQLIARIILSGNLRRNIEQNGNEGDFLTEENKQIYRMLRGYYSKYGEEMGPALASTKYFPNFDFRCVDASATHDILLMHQREVVLKKYLQEGLKQIQETLEHNPENAVLSLQEMVTAVHRMNKGKNTDVMFGSAMERLIDKYEQKKAGMAPCVCSWPWEPLNHESGGIQDDDYIVFYGRPKSKKTYTLTKIIAHGIEMGKRIGIYTKEMTPDNIFQRIAAFLARIPYSDVRHATLDPYCERRYRDVLEYAKEMSHENKIVCLNARDAAGGDTPSWLKAKAETFGFEMLFVDGLYLMTPDNPKISKPNERVAAISRALRDIPLATKIPVIATVQATRGASKHERGELDEIAFSDAISQDCTAAIRTINDATVIGSDGAPQEETITLAFAGSREYQLAGIRIYGVPCTNFDFKEVVSDAAINAATSTDVDAEEPSKKKGAKTPKFTSATAVQKQSHSIAAELADRLRNAEH